MEKHCPAIKPPGLYLPLMFAVLHHVVYKDVISKYEEDIPSHTAGYPERIAVKNHCTAFGARSRYSR